MTAAEPQHDPTMEEILASIRKIISEDQHGLPRQTAPAAETTDSDILELTDELPPDQNGAAFAPPEPRHPEPRAPELRAPEPRVQEPRPEPRVDALSPAMLSDTSREAIGRAFDSLDNVSSQYGEFAGGMLETVFARAVQDAVAPSLQQWVNGHEAELIEALKPMIRNWMDDHLPRLVQNVLKQELGRAITEHLRRRLT